MTIMPRERPEQSLSNTIYQRMKQVQSRLNRRNAEEQRRQDKAEKAKNQLWEEHQKQFIQFENYLCKLHHSRTPCSRRRARTAVARRAGTPCALPDEADTIPKSCPLYREDIVLEEEEEEEEIQGSTSLRSTPVDRITPTGLTTRDVPLTPLLKPPESFSPSLITSHLTTPVQSVPPSPQEKLDLARGLAELAWPEEMREASQSAAVLSHDFSNDEFSNERSPPPSLPSTPSECSTHSSPPTPIETPVVQLLMEDTPQETILPDISVTKLSVVSQEKETKQDLPTPRKKAPKKAVKKKKLTRKTASRNLLEQSQEIPEPVKPVPAKPTKEQAKEKIGEIFQSVNAMPEEELTEEAFTVFLDTIKQLSEYVDQDEVDSQNFEIIDDISSGFSSRAMEMAEIDSTMNDSPALLKTRPSSPQPEDPPTNIPGHQRKAVIMMKKQQAEERRKQRILVVKEKQAGIIRYRKVTMAELRLRRQRALMRVKTKLQGDIRERLNLENQRSQLFALAAMNEAERAARLAKLKKEEEEREAVEAEARRLKELKVKEELEELLYRSRQRQLQEMDELKKKRNFEDIEEDEQEEEDLTGLTRDDEQDAHAAKDKITRSWQTAARRVCNRESYDKMLRRGQTKLYRNLVKELFIHSQNSLITDIPGFSYFLLIKYTMDPDDIIEIMSDM